MSVDQATITKWITGIGGAVLLLMQGYNVSQIPGMERVLNQNHEEVKQDTETIKVEQRELTDVIREIKLVQQQQLEYAGAATEELKKINEKLDRMNTK